MSPKTEIYPMACTYRVIFQADGRSVYMLFDSPVEMMQWWREACPIEPHIMAVRPDGTEEEMDYWHGRMTAARMGEEYDREKREMVRREISGRGGWPIDHPANN